jgi:hypothetical protein
MPTNTSNSRITKASKHEDFIPMFIAILAAVTTPQILPSLFNYTHRRPMRTSPLSGSEYIQELLTCNHSERVQEVLRMKLKVFKFLREELKHCGLHDSKYITIDEQLAMFLYTVARNASNRDVQERFQHSGETVSRYFNAVLRAIHMLVPKYIKLYENDDIPTAISSNDKFYTFFDNCIGALDGTHISAKVPESEQAAFRNKKGILTQNVLGVCDFDDLCFTYVFAGVEGSAHDGKVIDLAFDAGFKVPAGKYYLADAGYALSPWCLTPYRGVRYHLKEWNKTNLRYL